MADRPIVVVSVALAALLAAGCARGAASASLGDRARGGEIFAGSCAVCHGAAGAGGVGPSLRNEHQRKNFAATVAWIEQPAPPMPKLYPAPLNDADVADVAAYVQSL